MSYYEDLSLEERRDKICELLVKGMHLHAEEEELIK